MGWLRLDDHYDDHPKVVEAGKDAAWLDIRAMLFCARHETDGRLREAQLARIGSDFAPRKRLVLAQRLVEVGRWERTEDGGWWIHDFLEYNPSSEKRTEERQRARERMEKARQNKRRRSSEQPPNNHGGSGNPDPNPAPITPPTPPEGGSRANGTNPRAKALQREHAQLREGIAACTEERCDHDPDHWTRLCSSCSGRIRKIGELTNA